MGLRHLTFEYEAFKNVWSLGFKTLLSATKITST